MRYANVYLDGRVELHLQSAAQHLREHIQRAGAGLPRAVCRASISAPKVRSHAVQKDVGVLAREAKVALDVDGDLRT